MTIGGGSVIDVLSKLGSGDGQKFIGKCSLKEEEKEKGRTMKHKSIIMIVGAFVATVFIPEACKLKVQCG